MNVFWSGHQPDVDGGAKRDRTADLLRAKQALSQLSYSPRYTVKPVGNLFNPVSGKAYVREVYLGKRPGVQHSMREDLVGLSGLEPPTSPLSGVRSNHLSYKPAGILLLVNFYQTICVSTSREGISLVRR